MDSRQISPFKPILTTALILFFTGAIGLVLIFTLTVPTLGPRWLLFFLIPLLFSGIALPFVWLLNRRLLDRLVTSPVVMMREAIFFGLYVDLMIWLQFGKVLNFALAFFVLAGFAIIEALLRWREQSRFNAGAAEEE